MTTIIDIQARLKRAVDGGETPYSLAKKAGLHRNTLYGWDSKGWNPTLATVEKLAPYLPEAA